MNVPYEYEWNSQALMHTVHKTHLVVMTPTVVFRREYSEGVAELKAVSDVLFSDINTTSCGLHESWFKAHYK